MIVEGSAREDESAEDINIVLITEEIDKVEIFVAEASKFVLIDRVCTKIVANKKWFEYYKLNLPEKGKTRNWNPIYWAKVH